MEVDRATFYALVLRFWQLPAGMVTTLLIVFFFSPEVQGYYYTILGLLALQTVAELGQQFVIASVAGHEWADLSINSQGSADGDRHALGRLAALSRIVSRWSALAALLFVPAVGGIGVIFFSLSQGSQERDISWRGPWYCLVMLCGLSLWLAPRLALLEGCGQTRSVHKVRLAQAVLSNLLVWTCIPLGAGLWAPVFAAVVKALGELALIKLAYGPFFRSLRQTAPSKEFDWSGEVWPLQWRAAVQSLFAYGAWQLFTPVMFHYHGAVIAGQMGLVWNVLCVLQNAAMSWMETRVWLFSQYVSKRSYRALDDVFVRLTLISTAALAAIVAGFCGAVYFLAWWDHPWAEKISGRLLLPETTAWLGVAVVLFHVPRCQTVFIRVHKRDPLFALASLGNAAVGLCVWQLGARFGPEGAAWGYLAVRGAFNVPVWTWVCFHFRRQWRQKFPEADRNAGERDGLGGLPTEL